MAKTDKPEKVTASSNGGEQTNRAPAGDPPSEQSQQEPQTETQTAPAREEPPMQQAEATEQLSRVRARPQVAATPFHQAAAADLEIPQAAQPAPAPSAKPARTRPVFGMPTMRLDVEKAGGKIKDGYVGRWVNDQHGRLDWAKECGYEHVFNSKGEPISRVVDKSEGTIGYCMQIPKEWYDEDQAIKQQKNDQTDDAIMRAQLRDGGYRPTRGGTDQPLSRQEAIRGRVPVA